MTKKSAPQLDERVEVVEQSASAGVARPPIVAVMGHVDHGKTTLLDFLRKTSVAMKEAGGITQSIGAYEIEHLGKRITFLDTPGHEAFSKMRTRGARVADIAILVVAADDSVKPQTKEVISILNETKTPYIVAINKIDKPNIDIEKTKTDLMQENVLLEGFGGDISWQAISAKTGEGVKELLDLILLTAEMQGFTYDPEAAGRGIIIEARRESRRGVMVTGIVRDGVLRAGDSITTASASGKIKILENFLGERVSDLTPSSPALILGFETLPAVGEEFYVGTSVAVPIAAERLSVPSISGRKTHEIPLFNIILKADVAGSLEALADIVTHCKQEQAALAIIKKEVGEITDGDVRFAAPTKAMIVGFNVLPTKAAENVAKSQEITVITSNIIYELVKRIEEELVLFGRPKPTGELSVLAVFSQKGKKQLVGGKVITGVMKNNGKVSILREEVPVGTGKITNLKSSKQEVKQISLGEECGIMIEAEAIVQVGDVLQINKEVER